MTTILIDDIEVNVLHFEQIRGSFNPYEMSDLDFLGYTDIEWELTDESDYDQIEDMYEFEGFIIERMVSLRQQEKEDYLSDIF